MIVEVTTGTRTEVSRSVRHAWLVATLSALASPAASADTFSSAYYDQKTNELVVTMTYRGTNPDHQFSIEWDQCQTPGDDDSTHEIVGTVSDSQWDDDAQATFTKTVRFSFAGVDCRPATVTLRTAPHFEYTLKIPE
jgi:hypothetical protein